MFSYAEIVLCGSQFQQESCQIEVLKMAYLLKVIFISMKEYGGRSTNRIFIPIQVYF